MDWSEVSLDAFDFSRLILVAEGGGGGGADMDCHSSRPTACGRGGEGGPRQSEPLTQVDLQ